MTHQRWDAEIKGLNDFDEDLHPTNVPGLYYAYHIMVGLGTIFIGLLLLAAIQLYRKRLYKTKWILWSLMLMVPLPYIANTASWYTAELGRQPWSVYDLLRTVDGVSPTVSSGNTLFTLLGFMGLYSMLFLINAIVSSLGGIIGLYLASTLKGIIDRKGLAKNKKE